MDDLLTDQQQAEVVKSWLRQNGPWLAAGVALGVGGLFGWFQWEAYRDRQAEAASALFEEFRQEAAGLAIEAPEARLKELATRFGDSGYTDQARLIMARVYLDRSDPNKAAEYLRQVANGPGDPEVRRIATLRLARLLVFQEKPDEALKVLAGSVPPAWAPHFHAVRGDAYFAQGKRAEARSEYEQALKPTDTQGLDRGYLEARLDDLGGPTTAPATATPPAAAPTAAAP